MTESPEEFLQRIEKKLLKHVDEELCLESVSRKPVVKVACVKISKVVAILESKIGKLTFAQTS